MRGNAGHIVQRTDLLLFALRRATNVVAEDFQTALGPIEIRPTTFAIMRLMRQQPGMRQSELSPAVGVRRTNLVPLLAELERRGLSERRPVPGDRRAAARYLTERGRALIDHCESCCERHEAELTQRLGDGGRARLQSLLARLGEPTLDVAPTMDDAT